MELTLTDYWMGRDASYPTAMTPAIRSNAQLTVSLVNELLKAMTAAGVRPHINPRTGTLLTSGWRPPTLNAGTPGAATNSRHMTGQAADLYDAEGEIDDWLMTDAGQSTLTRLGLWMEHPSATKGWAHVQVVPPRSGKRVFYP